MSADTPYKAPQVEVRNFTDFIEITQEVTHPKTKRATAYVLIVTSEQARTLAADLLKAAEQYDEGPVR